MEKEDEEVIPSRQKELSIADTFFRFPVRIFNEVDIKNALAEDAKNELAQLEVPPAEIPWILGQAQIPYRTAKDLYWVDAYSTSRTIEEVDKEGFDFTMLYSVDGDTFICGWKREKFEKNYFAYLSKMEKYFEQKKEKINLVV